MRARSALLGRVSRSRAIGQLRNSLRNGWRRYRSVRLAAHATLVALCATALVRGYGAGRLSIARAALADTVGHAELETVRGALEQREERPALRLAKAIGPYAVGKPEGQELLAQCRAAVAATMRLEQAGEAAPAAAIPRPPWANSGFAVPGLVLVGPAYNLLLRCGLASDADSFSPEIGLPAVELLGEVARDLERGPSLLALALGLKAEKHQLTLIERLHDRPLAPAERIRLRNALQTDDLASSRRRVLAAEALLASEYGTVPVADDPLLTRFIVFLVGPLAAAAQVDEITRILRDDERPPGWPDTWFVGAEGLRRSWQRLLDAPTEVALKRERVRRLLAL